MSWQALSPRQEVYVIIITFILSCFAFAWVSRKLPDDGIVMNPIKTVFLTIMVVMFLGYLIYRWKTN